MSRSTTYFTIDQFQSLLFKQLKQKKLREDFSSASLGAFTEQNAKVKKDLAKIAFGKENISVTEPELENIVGLHSLSIPHLIEGGPDGDLSYLGVLAGGEGQIPVFFILYPDWDGKIRAYIPEKGNSLDSKTKSAKPVISSDAPLSSHFNVDAIQADIQKRIKIYGSGAVEEIFPAPKP